jgi:two-component system phosphate regulon response regulator PhoB
MQISYTFVNIIFAKTFMPNKTNILVVDDEESLCEILQFNLEIEGYHVDVAYSAEQALQMDLEKYSLILLDIMMGRMSGLKMAQEIKRNERTAHIPIIFCTAKESEDDTVTGLNIGADDYITKPFSVREVVARVKSVLRRTEKKNQINCEKLCVDVEKKRCTLDGKEIELTKKELEILILFMKNKGKIFSREEILSRVWDNEVDVFDRTVDVNITRLRKKIGRFIVTRIGYGYGFRAEN